MTDQGREPGDEHGGDGSSPVSRLAAIPATGRIMAVDWGERRIGLAITDELQLLATPLDTLTRRPGKRFPMPRFLEHVTTQAPVAVVVGLPLDPSGAEGYPATEARQLARQIEERTRLPDVLWDERMTTARALTTIRDQGGSTRDRKGDVDALAAAMLLQAVLDARRATS